MTRDTTEQVLSASLEDLRRGSDFAARRAKSDAETATDGVGSSPLKSARARVIRELVRLLFKKGVTYGNSGKLQRVPWGLIAAVLFILGADSLVTLLSSDPVIVTNQIGQVTPIRLHDGTVITLNTISRIAIAERPRGRYVTLSDGEGLFQVVHDSHRPFHVRVGNIDIRDVGTTFDVYRKSDGSVLITVIDGEVVVSRHKDDDSLDDVESLRTNQQIEYTADGMPLARKHFIDADNVISWIQGSLIVMDVSITQLATEMNRYSKKKIVINDPNLASIRVGGVWPLRDPGMIVETLKSVAPITVAQTDDTYVISLQSEGEKPRVDKSQ